MKGRNERFFFFECNILKIPFFSVTSLLQKRGAGSTFASNTDHTPVFNTVHIIAAVIGILGIIAVIFTVIFVCRRKRNKKTIQQVKEDIENKIIQQQRSHQSSIHSENRFGQFANDFDNAVVPPKPAIIQVEDVSPMMQQYQLQLKLLQQQQEERKQNNNNTLAVPAHHRANSSSSSSSSSPSSLLPPPPYHP